jgi:hypothetical protein
MVMVIVIVKLLLGENHRLRGLQAVKAANAAPKRGAMLLAVLRVAKNDFATALTQLVIAGQKARSAVLMSNDPAIHAADKSAWTTGSSPVVTKNGRVAP